jgi:hypothetical protein
MVASLPRHQLPWSACFDGLALIVFGRVGIAPGCPLPCRLPIPMGKDFTMASDTSESSFTPDRKNLREGPEILHK